MVKPPENYTSGNYSVGTETFSFVDTGRKELLGNADEDRKIAVRMYYPISSEDAVGREPAVVFSENKKVAIGKAYHAQKMDPSFQTANYFEKAPHMPGETFSLILFSHGYNSYIEANTYLCCNMASHGYVVASVGHAYEAVENDYEDGSFDLYDKKINKKMYDSMVGTLIEQYKLLKKKMSPEEAVEKFNVFQNKHMSYVKKRLNEWALDMQSALREIRSRYADRIDFSGGVGVSGHSLGGATAYYLCQHVPEFACGINIDGAVFGDYEGKTMTKPFFQIGCKENINLESRPLLSTTAPVHYAMFSGMKHMGFTDVKFYLPLKFLTGKMPADRMFDHLAVCHVKFFDKYLKKKDVTLELRMDVK